jgi:RNA polymerase sigma-70 factor (ECF subfamily)
VTSDQDSLVDDLRAGGKKRERALRAVYVEYAEPIRSFYRSKGLSPENAEDVLQDTFVNMLKSLASYRGDSRFSAWLWAIARNQIKMHWRSAKNREEGTDPDTFSQKIVGDREAGQSVTEQLVDCVRKAIDNFSLTHMEYADVIRLTAVYQWSIADVAAYLEKKPGATREYLSQARKKIQPFIAHCYELLKG